MPVHDHLGDCYQRPELRSVDHSRVYVEPDYMANDCDVQLPLVSAVGKGERGNGIIVQADDNGQGGFSFKILDEQTNEVVLQSPDLSAPNVSVQSVVHNPTAGEAVPVIFRVTRGSEVADYTVQVPAGATGSLIYLYDKPLNVAIDGTYQLYVTDLTIYGASGFPSKPDPRQNDIVFFRYARGLAFGTIEAVEDGIVTFTCRTMVPWPQITIGKSGKVYIDGEDVGVNIMGPKGDKGDQGDPGKPAVMLIGNVMSASKPGADIYVSNAAKNEYTLDLKLQRGEKGVKGDKGQDGKDGKDPKLVVGKVTETSQPMANVRMTNAQENEYTIDFGFPRGADGKSVNINGGIYKVKDLPNFDGTPINDAFIVDDEDGRYDLYIRAIDPVIASEGGPWTVVEDWQGIQGFSMRRLKAPHKLGDDPLEFSKDDLDEYLAPTNSVLDGDLVVDDDLCLGVVSSAFDQSGTYVVTRVSSEVADFVKKFSDYLADFKQEVTAKVGELESKIAEETDGFNVIAPKHADAAANASANKALAAGNAASATGQSSIAIGDGANVGAYRSIAVGRDAGSSSDLYSHSVNIGTESSAHGSKSVCVGDSTTSYGSSVAIGCNAKALNTGSAAIGESSTTARDYEVSVGSDAQKRFLANISDPTLAQDAATKNYVDGLGYVPTATDDDVKAMFVKS